MAVFVSAIGAAVGTGLTDGFLTNAFLTAGLTAVADTGVALSVIGGVTGNSNLAKIGGTMGLVGGLGEMANNGTFFGSRVGSDTSVEGQKALSTGSPSIDAPSSGAVDSAAGGGAVTGDTLSQVQGSLPASTGSPVYSDPNNPTSANTQPSGSSSSGIINAQPYDAQSAAYPQASPNNTLVNNPATQPSFINPNNTSIGTGGADTQNFLSNAFTQMGTTAGQLGDSFSKLNPFAQAEIVKAAMSVPGGIMAQQNKAKELATQQQQANTQAGLSHTAPLASFAAR